MTDGRCVCDRKKERSAEDKDSLVKRLNIIEGQVRGIRGMIESDAYCPEVLIQISAVSSALASLSKQLLASHISTCVSEDIKAGKEDAAFELSELVKRLIK